MHLGHAPQIQLSRSPLPQVLTVKSKFIVENQTGAPLEIKQRGTPDLEAGSRQDDRCARMLLHEQRYRLPLQLTGPNVGFGCQALGCSAV